jgi:hypothetical protein
MHDVYVIGDDIRLVLVPRQRIGRELRIGGQILGNEQNLPHEVPVTLHGEVSVSVSSRWCCVASHPRGPVTSTPGDNSESTAGSSDEAMLMSAREAWRNPTNVAVRLLRVRP